MQNAYQIVYEFIWNSVHRFYYSVYAPYVPGAILAIWDTSAKKKKKLNYCWNKQLRAISDIIQNWFEHQHFQLGDLGSFLICAMCINHLLWLWWRWNEIIHSLAGRKCSINGSYLLILLLLVLILLTTLRGMHCCHCIEEKTAAETGYLAWGCRAAWGWHLIRKPMFYTQGCLQCEHMETCTVYLC